MAVVVPYVKPRWQVELQHRRQREQMEEWIRKQKEESKSEMRVSDEPSSSSKSESMAVCLMLLVFWIVCCTVLLSSWGKINDH